MEKEIISHSPAFTMEENAVKRRGKRQAAHRQFEDDVSANSTKQAVISRDIQHPDPVLKETHLDTVFESSVNASHYFSDVGYQTGGSPQAVYEYGKTIDHFRRAKELSQKDLAILCDLSVSYISEIINGKKIPDTLTLEKICYKLDISLPIFFVKALKKPANINHDSEQNNEHIRMLLLGLAECLNKNVNDNNS